MTYLLERQFYFAKATKNLGSKMKRFVSLSLSLSLLLVATSSLLSRHEDADFSSGCDRERVCSKNPLYCDGFNLSFHAGVSPILWLNRGCLNFLTTGTCISNSFVSLCPVSECYTGCSPAACSPSVCAPSACCPSTCCFDSADSVAGISIPKFSKMFNTPWTIGTTLGYAITQNHEVFAEFNYTEAQNEPFFEAQVTNAAGLPVLIQTNLVSKYKNVSGYFGYRYNFDRGCKRNVSWFLDAKVGLVHHYKMEGFINSTPTLNIVDGSTTAFFPLFKSNTAFSGAGEVGVDICLNCDWSLIIAAEVAATWGPRCKQYARLVEELGTPVIADGSIGAEILFPITFGLRYKF